MRKQSFIDLPADAQARLVAGARDSAPVAGLTHGFYKYPARFSPAFARAAIESFTEPGDLVLDPHVGGGTTLVEAIAAGRHAIGVDISELAEFVATVKTTVYTDSELDKLAAWAKRVASSIGVRKRSATFEGYVERGYYKHLDHSSRWRLRKAIEQALLSATSPPYPGVHVLYHRWQVDGRKETPAPFWIAGKLDGSGGSYYTMGDRKHPELRTYFENIKATMSSVAAVADERTVVVQISSWCSVPSTRCPRSRCSKLCTGSKKVPGPILRENPSTSAAWQCGSASMG